MQRTAPFPTRDFDFRSPCFGQRRFGSHRDKCIQRGIKFLDAIQASTSQFQRGNFFPPQTRGKLNNGFEERHGRWRLYCSGRSPS